MSLKSHILQVSRLSMGTEFQVLMADPDLDFLEDVGNEVTDVIDRVEARLSHYQPDSEITDLNLRAAYEPVLLEPSLLELLQRAAALSAATDGAFDCTAGPLIRCWGFFRGKGQ